MYLHKYNDAEDLKLAFYDPKKLDTKPSFPFRATTFTLDPSKVRAVKCSTVHYSAVQYSRVQYGTAQYVAG